MSLLKMPAPGPPRPRIATYRVLQFPSKIVCINNSQAFGGFVVSIEQTIEKEISKHARKFRSKFKPYVAAEGSKGK